MRQLSVIAVAAIATTIAASAPARAQTSWAGPYVGLNAGYAGSADDQVSNSGTDTGAGGLGTALRLGAIPHTIHLGNDTPLFGLQGGYNWRLGGMYLLGGEADFDIGGMSNHNSTTPAVAGVAAQTTNTSRQLDWLTTLRARAGIVPTDPLLLYLTGGIAFGENKNGIAVVCNTCVPPTASQNTTASRRSDTGFGWTAGAGGEWAINSQFSLKAEYLYVDLGHSNEHLAYNYGANTSTLNAQFHNSDHILRVGFNYHFRAPTPPPARPAAAPPPPPLAPQQQIFIVFFEFDKSALTADGKRVVDEAAGAFRSGKSSVAIAGYTDLAGSQQYNLALSKRRADTVKAALVRDGVPAAVIDEQWFGKQNPRVPTADGVREPQNRRVEITM
jgi:outer membrane protein OmpA-like peptidoglycan-associated protein